MRKALVLLLFLSTITLCQAQDKAGQRWSIDAGIGYMLNDNYDAGIVNVGFQKRVTNYLSIGATTGFYLGSNDDITPMLFDARADFPIGSSQFSWLGIARAGFYAVNLFEDYCAAIELLPGIKYTFGKHSEVRLNIGFCTASETMFSVQLGYSFRL